MYVHDEYSYCYLAAPRTGSVAISHHLLLNGWRQVGNHHDVLVNDLHKYDTIAASVRHHFNCIRSWYGMASRVPTCSNCGHQEREPFEQWVNDFLYQRIPHQYIHLYGRDQLFRPFTRYASHILHNEKLPQDLWSVFPRCFNAPAPVAHVSRSDFQAPELPTVLKAMIYDRYQTEMRRLGYAWVR